MPTLFYKDCTKGITWEGKWENLLKDLLKNKKSSLNTKNKEDVEKPTQAQDSLLPSVETSSQESNESLVGIPGSCTWCFGTKRELIIEETGKYYDIACRRCKGIGLEPMNGR
jgi:hypothetical protein